MSNAYPCDPRGFTLAAALLEVEINELYPGERYPTTGSCVVWSGVVPGEFVVIQLDGIDSDPPAWPCDPDQVTEQERAVIHETPAWVRACTIP